MAEVSLEDLTQEQRQRLIMDMPIGQLSSEQFGFAMNQLMPNPTDRGQNDMTPYEFKKPENFKQGVQSFFKNAVGNPLMEALYLREPLEDRVEKMRIRGYEADLADRYRESQQRRSLASSIALNNPQMTLMDFSTLANMDYDDLSKLASQRQSAPTELEGYPGTSVTTNPFSREQTVIVAPTTDAQNVMAAGGESEYQQILSDRKGSEERGKVQAEIDLTLARAIQERQKTLYNKVNDTADASRDSLDNWYTLQNLLSSGGVSQGFGANEKLALRRIGAAFGFETEGVKDEILFNSIANQMALTARNPESGMGMPGAMSEADREFLRSLFPVLANTPGGNALMVEAQIMKAQRNIEIRQMMNEYLEANGTLAGFDKKLDEYVNNPDNQMFGEIRLKAHSLVNQHRASQGLEPVDYKTVRNN